MIRLRKSNSFGRRSFLQRGAALGTVALTSPLALLRTKVLAQGLDLCGTRGASPYGPLVPAKDQATGLELIMLPRGFRYTTFSWKGDLMSDGNIVPSGHDGMHIVQAANPGGVSAGRSQEFVLIRNHEVFGVGHTPIAPNFNYDSQGGGGTTVLRVSGRGQLFGHGVSISGTSSNCAGGPTPWGSWLTCEEGVDVGDVPHGYVFESTVQRVVNPTPLTSMGRFTHEAVAFDPRTGVIYLTEDDSSSIPGDPSPRRRGNSGFYRFVPNAPLGGQGSLAGGGLLYMLKAKDVSTGAPVDDLRNPLCFATYDVEWVLIEDPDAEPVGSVSGPYVEGRSKGGSRFQRLEGCSWEYVCMYAI